MYADGVIEASYNADNFFGLDRLKEILGGGHALEADLLGETVLTAVDEWSGRALGDDVTIVVADWTGLRDVDRLDARI